MHDEKPVRPFDSSPQRRCWPRSHQAPTPARADRCDDLANQLKNQIDGLAVGKTAANLIYLSHPKAKELTLGCAGRSYANQLYAKSDSRKPQAAFIDLVASAAAIVFTLPKDDMLRARRDASSGWASSMATTSTPATAASTCAASGPRPRPRSRSPAAPTSRREGVAAAIAILLWNSEPAVHPVTGRMSGAGGFPPRIHKTFVCASSQSGTTSLEDFS